MAVAMETPDTKRAKQLKDIYLLLRIPDLEVDERLDALLQLKAVVEPYPDKLCREILDLVQREAELVARQIKGAKLQGCSCQHTLLLLLLTMRSTRPAQATAQPVLAIC